MDCANNDLVGGGWGYAPPGKFQFFMCHVFIMAKHRGALPPYVLNWGGGGKYPPSPPVSYASVK